MESLIDELISEILSESGASADTAKRGMRTSMLERLLLAEALAAELADALAPALAEQLAPRLLKSLEEELMAETERKKPTPASRSGASGRKPEAKQPT